MTSWKQSALGLLAIVLAAFVAIGLQRWALGEHLPQQAAAKATATPVGTAPGGPAEPTAQASATPKPANPPVVTGEATVDAVISRVASNQSGTLAPLLQTTSVPCRDDYSIYPVCQGKPAGTMVDSVWSFQCEARWVPTNLASSSQGSWLIGRYQLYAVLQGGPPAARSPEIPVDRWLLFTALDPGLPGGLAVAVANGRVVAYGYSCGNAATLMVDYLAPTTQFLVPPVGTLSSAMLLRVKQGTGCLDVRESAAMAAKSIDCVAEGTYLADLGETIAADGVTWLHVGMPKGQHGWVSNRYVEQ